MILAGQWEPSSPRPGSLDAPDYCPWCGYVMDCEPYKPGKSGHHSMCCADRYSPSCTWGKPNDLARIMREDREAEWS